MAHRKHNSLVELIFKDRCLVDCLLMKSAVGIDSHQLFQAYLETNANELDTLLINTLQQQ